MPDHWVAKCEHGETHGQCRCASPLKSVVLVDCPTPGDCTPYQGKHVAAVQASLDRD